MAKKPVVASSAMIGKGLTGVTQAVDSLAVIQACLDYLRIREEETTKRTYIAAQREVLVQAISSERELLIHYMGQRFAERKAALDQLFAILQQGVEARDHHIIDQSLGGILGILKDNPLSDLATFRAQWNQPSFVIDL